jgi:hypothetical protein
MVTCARRQRVGETSGGTAMREGPGRDAALLLVDGERSGEMRHQLVRFVPGEQQRALHAEEFIDLAQRRERRGVEVARLGQRACEVEERGGPLLAQPFVASLGADARRELADDDRHREIRPRTEWRPSTLHDVDT